MHGIIHTSSESQTKATSLHELCEELSRTVLFRAKCCEIYLKLIKPVKGQTTERSTNS